MAQRIKAGLLLRKPELLHMDWGILKGNIAEQKYIDPAEKRGYTFMECVVCHDHIVSRKKWSERPKDRAARVRQWKASHNKTHPKTQSRPRH